MNKTQTTDQQPVSGQWRQGTATPARRSEICLFARSAGAVSVGLPGQVRQLAPGRKALRTVGGLSQERQRQSTPRFIQTTKVCRLRGRHAAHVESALLSRRAFTATVSFDTWRITILWAPWDPTCIRIWTRWANSLAWRKRSSKAFGALPVNQTNVGVETAAKSHVEEYYTPASVRRVLEYTAVDYVLLGMPVPDWAQRMLQQQP